MLGNQWNYTTTADLDPGSAKFISLDQSGASDSIRFHSFLPGTVTVFEISPSAKAQAAATELNQLELKPETSALGKAVLRALKGVDLVALNHLLFRCQAEEDEAEGTGDAIYDVPGFGALTYCGIQGAVTVLDEV